MSNIKILFGLKLIFINLIRLQRLAGEMIKTHIDRYR